MRIVQQLTACQQVDRESFRFEIDFPGEREAE
jgi:hypothetical protein